MFFSRKKNQIFIHISSSKIFLVLGEKIDKRFTIKKLAQFSLSGEGFKTFLKEEKLEKEEVQVVLGGEELFSRIILIPGVPEKEIKKILAWELRKHLSIGWEEDIIFDYHHLGPIEITHEKLQGHLVIGGRKNYLQSFLEFFANLGLTIKSMDVEAMILKDVYEELEGIKTPHDCCLYLIEDGATLAFFKNEKLIYTTSFKLNGSLEILEQKFYQSLEYLRKYFYDISLGQVFLLGDVRNDFSQTDFENALKSTTIYIDIKDIYCHLGDMDLDNKYLMSMALAFKEVNKK